MRRVYLDGSVFVLFREPHYYQRNHCGTVKHGNGKTEEIDQSCYVTWNNHDCRQETLQHKTNGIQSRILTVGLMNILRSIKLE